MSHAAAIEVKALGLHWKGNALLASEIRESDGSLKGVRPLGGTVEFGETTAQTVVREFQEELGQTVTITGAPFVLENIFHHLGARGHEIVFLYPIAFPSGVYDATDLIHYQEDNGETCVARWWDIATLDTEDGLSLYPNALKAHLTLPN